MTRIRIDLREISRRMLQKYYPVWLLIIIFSDLAYATMDLNIAIKRGWFKLFVTDGLVSVFIYLTIIGALFFLKPYHNPVRIGVMVVSMLLSASLSTFIICRINNLPPIPFSDMDQVTSLLMGYFTSGICIIWFFSIEERQYIAEKKIAAARIKVALNEKKVLENHLRLLQAQIEPHFLFNTLTSIVSHFRGVKKIRFCSKWLILAIFQQKSTKMG
jgi:sensor histidine kinase YesM